MIGLDSDKSKKEKITQADKKIPETEPTEPKEEKPTTTDSSKDTPVKEGEEKPARIPKSRNPDSQRKRKYENRI